MIEIDSLEAFDLWAAGPCEPAAIQGLDFTDREHTLCGLCCPGSLFLACTMSPVAAGSLVMCGAVVMPDFPNRDFTVHRAQLYAAEELYDVFDPARPASFAECLDQRIYRQYLADGKSRPTDIAAGMAQGLHDHSITAALFDLIEGERVVAVMGGHGMERSDPRYRAVVVLSKALAERGYLLVSGGGPGAMEATHLGAWLANRPDSDIDAVLNSAFTKRPAGSAPGKEYGDPDWLQRAWQVRLQWPRVDATISVGIPTWLYGHEPPTPFATHIAKYFANSIREDGVLAVANHGVVFAPGSAGTTQEIFQDACQNHYGTVGLRSPMILLDRAYWTDVRPVWPLLDAVSRDLTYGELVTLVDSADEVLSAVQSFEPSWYRVSEDPELALESALRRGVRLRGNWEFERVERADLSGSSIPASARDLAVWLHQLGDDDWVDLEAATAVWTEILAGDPGLDASLAPLADVPALTSRQALILKWPAHTAMWRAILRD